MNVLLSDPLFRMLGGGSLLSGFFFLLAVKKFRAAGQPASEGLLEDVANAAATEPVKVVQTPKTAVIFTVAETVKSGEAEAASKKTGGEPALSPAVLYLRNLKGQIEHFEKEINQLRGQVVAFSQKHDQQFDALISRIGELHGELHVQMHGAAEPETQTAHGASEEQDRTQVFAPLASAPVVQTAGAAPTASEAASSRDGARSPAVAEPQSMRLDLPPEKSPEPVPEAAPPDQTVPDATQPILEEDILKPKGKGPVWPV